MSIFKPVCEYYTDHTTLQLAYIIYFIKENYFDLIWSPSGQCCCMKVYHVWWYSIPSSLIIKAWWEIQISSRIWTATEEGFPHCEFNIALNGYGYQIYFSNSV